MKDKTVYEILLSINHDFRDLITIITSYLKSPNFNYEFFEKKSFITNHKSHRTF
jgi:hypothetical protein